MTWEIKQENGIKVGYIDVNGKQECIKYDPSLTPGTPFSSLEALREYIIQLHTEMETLSSSEIPQSKEWHPHDFWLRFPQDKQIKIIEAARSDANVENFRMQLLMIGRVVIDHPVTISGMNYLVSQGLLTETEKDQILGGE